MKKQLTEAKSDISRTNQLQILPEQNIVEKLELYLRKADKGIESFPLKYERPTSEENEDSENSDSEAESTDNEESKYNYYRERHKWIKNEIKKRLSKDGKRVKYGDIQYFISTGNKKKYIFFLSPNKNHSGWKNLFKDNRERIFNLVFKFYLLSQALSTETIDTFEELFLVHYKSSKQSKKSTKSKAKPVLFVWGQNILVKYNQHDVLTLTLTRKRRKFLPTDSYSIADGEDLGELLTYKKKNYYFERDLDARRSNFIYFMDFRKDKDGEKYNLFKKTQLYHYQNLIRKLQEFLKECDINFEILNFQADHYLENPFIKNIEAVESLEIINNIGIDLTEGEQDFLQNFLKYQVIPIVTFYNSGKTISTYEKIEDEDDTYWRITEVIFWDDIKLDKKKNYLIFNKLLESEVGSRAYQRDDGYWCPSTKLDDKLKIDFYSQLKKKFNYLYKGKFYSTQGIDIPEFTIIQKAKEGQKKEEEEINNLSFITYNSKIDKDIVKKQSEPLTNGQFLDLEDSLICYLTKQNDSEKYEKFLKQHKLKIVPEFQKVLIELGIKNWIRKSLLNSDFSLRITPQSFSKHQFFAIYVRSPKNKETQAVAVEFICQDGCVYINDIMRDLKQINKRFRFLRKTKNNSEKLINNQQYFVDEANKLYINCYTDDYFTPTLIGREGILEELENETLKVNKTRKGKDSSKLLPLVMYYNEEYQPFYRIQNTICFDLQKETFVQYYVPSAQPLESKIKKGFRVYHLIGKTYSEKSIPTSKLIELPIVALHFSTLTQNILKISDNSQSSLLQKIAKVLIEN